MPVKEAALMGCGGGGILLCLRRFNLPSCSCLVSLKPQLANTSAIQHNFSSSFTNQRSFLAKTHHNPRLGFLLRAAESTQSPPSATAGTTDKSTVPDEEFSLAKVSFGVIGLGLGVSLLSYGFGAYFNILPGSEWSALMLTYGFPLAIIGMALKYAELKPVPCLTYSDAQMLREKCATPILKQVRNDVTRYRYGDEQHLDEALKRIFQYGMGGGISRRSAPILQMIREEAKALQLSDFEQRQAKFTSFFGPGSQPKF